MQKRSLAILSLVFLFILSCSSPKKLVEKGKYDQAISMLIPKLKKKPANEKSIRILQDAWLQANTENEIRIKQLRETGQPDIWYAIFRNYIALDKRQNAVMTLPAGVLSAIGFEKKEYSSYIDDARQKAAVYLYAHAKKLLEGENKQDARQAYQELKKVSSLYKNYKEVDELLRKALVKGTDNIEYEVRNQSASVLPSYMFSKLQNIDLSSLDEIFVQFHNYPQKGVDYDYKIRLTLTSVKITPDKQSTDPFTETRKIQVGWIEKRDSTGKEIKIPEYENVSSDVTLVQQYKSARIRAYLDFIDNAGQKVLIKVPVEAESVFSNKYATASGNTKACSMEVHTLLNNPRMIFPADDDLVLDAAKKLNHTIRQLIWEDESYIKD
ncbi:MAG: hypothetical protein U5Q03_10200 [Bacteroidota bacterium]|nr:hypothetical protein [Bacteroidota bacterium]